jgi:hypothetical protein
MLTVLRAHEKKDHDGLLVETLVSTIALSPIIRPQATDLLPARFEESASSGESPTIRFPVAVNQIKGLVVTAGVPNVGL